MEVETLHDFIKLKFKKERIMIMANSMNEMFHGMFGGVTPGKCRLAMNGKIAVKTSNGYKTYDPESGRLTNCSNFVFDVGDEMFFVIPTNRVHKGDLILVGDRAKNVIEATKEHIRAFDYENSTIEDIVPERHMFMGNTYFYGKIVSMFGETGEKNKKSVSNIMKYMALTKMMKQNNSGTGYGQNDGSGNDQLMMLMMLGGGNFGSIFDGMFDFDIEDEEEKEIPDKTEDDIKLKDAIQKLMKRNEELEKEVQNLKGKGEEK